MKKRWSISGLLLLLALSNGASAAVNVFACEPEWGALAQELGGDKVTVYNATIALQDPHRIQARPSLIARARAADLLVCTGAELEIGWLPILLRQSANPNIQPGKPGYFEAANYVKRMDVPTRLDRSEGDVHPGGNPHIQTDPRNILLVSHELAQRLAQIDPANGLFYEARHKEFVMRWSAAIQRWEKEAAPLKGAVIMVQHKGFPYLENWLGLNEVAALEPKPGVEPSSGHLTDILALMQRQKPVMIIRAAYNDGRASEWLAERSKVPVVVLPFTVGGSDKAKDLYGLFDDTIQRLLGALK